MCEQCTTEALTYGEVIPGWLLMRAQKDGNRWKAGEWGLVWSNDPSFTWTSTPTPNPAFGLDDEAEEALYEANKGTPIGDRIASMKLPQDFKDAFEAVTPRAGYSLVCAAMEKGYDPETSGDFSWWFYDCVGEHLKTAVPHHHGAVD